ncbi:hypothetical protein [Desulfovibrio aminophilus]|uniref:hypothetical protein n=1 Tax=Desulfovibrio aminophilus TaxID=81425 RepID=UPI0033956C95
MDNTAALVFQPVPPAPSAPSVVERPGTRPVEAMSHPEAQPSKRDASSDEDTAPRNQAEGKGLRLDIQI